MGAEKSKAKPAKPATSATIETTATPASEPTSTPATPTPDHDRFASATSSSTTSSGPKSAPAAKPHKTRKPKKPRTKGQKIFLGFIIILLISLAVAIGIILWLSQQDNLEASKADRVEFPDPVYSTLSGLEITNESLNSSPTYCVQIPNGVDGGRPQAGLTQAAVVFEAIAETNITRFAAIFQNPTTSVIGPIRSLRPYYLDWDTPFDCTVVHAGGSNEAMAALRRGGQRDLNESRTYMWREQGSGRGWNNLFTSPSDLADFNNDHEYHTSNVRSFPHLTPDQAQEAVNNATTCTTDENGAEACITRYVENIAINFGPIPTFNTRYTYSPETNSYLRSYANGDVHLVYDCPAGLDQPNTKTDCGDLVPVNPKVVVAMIVREGLMSDDYHEDITTIGSGNAIIFQNGQAIEGTWSKLSQKDQIVFRDTNGDQIKFTPGQLWIAAVPQYGRIDY